MNKIKVGYLAVGNYGTKLLLTEPNKHPRGQLLKALGRSTCKSQFCDKQDGTVVLIGYVVGGEWFTIYEVYAWERGTYQQIT